MPGTGPGDGARRCREGYVSAESARSITKAIDPKTLEIDVEETGKLRQ
jgi:hypothetical protein